MPEQNGRDRRFVISWDLTERCNLHCRQCRQDGAFPAEMQLSDIIAAFQDITDSLHAWEDSSGRSCMPRFVITGGEPFVRRDLRRVLEILTHPEHEVRLCTNGTLVDRARAAMLADLGIAGVQVSIEGPDDIHDHIRGEGSFDRAVDGIEHLLDAGLKVTVHAALSNLNARCLMKVVAFASHMGIQRIGCSRLLPCGRRGAMAVPLLPPEEVRALYRSLFALELRNIGIVSGDPLSKLLDPRSQGKDKTGKKKNGRGEGTVPSGGCSAGVSGIALLSDGTMTPCRRMHVPLGNLRRDSLRAVWTDSPVLQALRTRSRYTGKCGRCARWENCRGCRAIAYAWSRSLGGDDFLADDPQCFIDDQDRLADISERQWFDRLSRSARATLPERRSRGDDKKTCFY